ncbi:hypothetical protein SAMN05216355_10685 [Actinomyces ruminicola]|uniref:Uncharacterized protein n=1 Tax=Actinomyces ruminicola TaxID=332524 RepID=A0A1H0CB26_9ACTO|nr:hypothetical protein SAMN05216355_10685 [Actinomyces ruminicola]
MLVSERGQWRKITVIRTYSDFAAWKADEADNHFAVQVLKNLVTELQAMAPGPELDQAHGEPPSTGHPGWDRLIQGAALWTGASRLNDPAVLDWARRTPDDVSDIFDPLAPQRRFALSYLRTPVPLREKGVCLARGNLQGV